MLDKVSDRLEALVRGAGAGIAPVKVRLRAGLNPQTLKTAVQKIKSHLGGAEYLSISGTVHARNPRGPPSIPTGGVRFHR